MNSFIFFKPVLKEMIWGGERLSKFGYDLKSDKTGEAWTISGHKNGVSICTKGEFHGTNLSGMGLKEIWEKYPEIFGNKEGEKGEFPLLIKYIDAKDNLSIQVHPGDEYAFKNENGSKGKTECWYILDCDKYGDIVTGHNAKTREELKEMISSGKWEELLNIIPIKPGDFFYIEAGTVHAIRKGTLLIEIQQSSDVTYRLYDYDRLDKGVPRQLHIDKSIDVIKVPGELKVTRKPGVSLKSGYREVLADEEYFFVEHIEIKGREKIALEKSGFHIVNIISGKGKIQGEDVSMGDNFIIPVGIDEIDVEGNIEMIVSVGK